MKKIAYFISGEGRVVLSCINFINKYMSDKAENSLLVYSTNCNAVKNIEHLKIKSHIVNDNWKKNRENICNQICDLCLENEIDFIVMVFDKLLYGKIINIYKNKILNLHPSLLPSFKGLNAVEKALDYNSRFIGCTTHFIDDKMDEGILLCQGITPVEQNLDINEIKNKHFLLLKRLYLSTLWFCITDNIEILDGKSYMKNIDYNSLEINPKPKTDIIDRFIEETM